jgi:predicted nucleic acid-binding protein
MMMHGWRKITMKNKAYDLSSYSFSSDEQVLVDTNVWLYLFPAPANPSNRFAIQYSTAFSSLVSAHAQPVLDPMVLSEYLNRYIRIEWEGNYKSSYPKFKDFRNSADFSAVASAAETFAKKILSFCQIHSIPANELDLSQALADFSAGGVDFNDVILVDICKKRNLKLMTNDGDFQDGGIEVLTTNPRLLRACP